MSKKSGFTLIELLVVISIIAILSVVGLVVFQNAQKSAKDAKIKADLNAIKKAYETNYDPTLNGGQGGYKPLNKDTDFAGGKIPTPPGGGSYTFAYGPDAADAAYKKDDGYRVSATLSDEKSSIEIKSTQGTLAGTAGGNILSSCDPQLASSLVNYYQMGTVTGGVTADSKGGTAATVVNVTTAPGILGNAASFNGSAYIKADPSSPSSFTVSVWIKSEGNNSTSFFWEGGGVSAPSIEGTDNNYQFYMSNGPNLNTGSITPGTWYLISATYDAGSRTQSLYVNTESKGSKTNVNSNNLNPLYIGSREGTSYFYKGLIDEVAIFNRALSGSEIAKIYNLGQGCSII